MRTYIQLTAPKVSKNICVFFSRAALVLVGMSETNKEQVESFKNPNIQNRQCVERIEILLAVRMRGSFTRLNAHTVPRNFKRLCTSALCTDGDV